MTMPHPWKKGLRLTAYCLLTNLHTYTVTTGLLADDDAALHSEVVPRHKGQPQSSLTYSSLAYPIPSQLLAKFRCLDVCHSLCPLKRQGKCSLWHSDFQQLKVTEFVRSQMKPVVSAASSGTSSSFFRSNLNTEHNQNFDHRNMFLFNAVVKVSKGQSVTVTMLEFEITLSHTYGSWFMIHDQVEIKLKLR